MPCSSDVYQAASLRGGSVGPGSGEAAQCLSPALGSVAPPCSWLGSGSSLWGIPSRPPADRLPAVPHPCQKEQEARGTEGTGGCGRHIHRHVPVAGQPQSRPTALLKRWLPCNQRQGPTRAGHQRAAVLGEEEQGESCPIVRIDQCGAHGPVVLPDELHCSCQPRGLESARPHALKSAAEDAGMRTSGLYPLFHRVRGAAAQGGQSCRGRLVIPINSDSSTCRSMATPVWIVRYSSQVPQPWYPPSVRARRCPSSGLATAWVPGRPWAVEGRARQRVTARPQVRGHQSVSAPGRIKNQVKKYVPT